MLHAQRKAGKHQNLSQFLLQSEKSCSHKPFVCVRARAHTHIYIHTYICTCVCVCVCVSVCEYIFVEREREREREGTFVCVVCVSERVWRRHSRPLMRRLIIFKVSATDSRIGSFRNITFSLHNTGKLFSQEMKH